MEGSDWVFHISSHDRIDSPLEALSQSAQKILTAVDCPLGFQSNAFPEQDPWISEIREKSYFPSDSVYVCFDIGRK